MTFLKKELEPNYRNIKFLVLSVAPSSTAGSLANDHLTEMNNIVDDKPAMTIQEINRLLEQGGVSVRIGGVAKPELRTSPDGSIVDLTQPTEVVLPTGDNRIEGPLTGVTFDLVNPESPIHIGTAFLACKTPLPS